MEGHIYDRLFSIFRKYSESKNFLFSGYSVTGIPLIKIKLSIRFPTILPHKAGSLYWTQSCSATRRIENEPWVLEDMGLEVQPTVSYLSVAGQLQNICEPWFICLHNITDNNPTPWNLLSSVGSTQKELNKGGYF